jgi:hypothetical protein
MFGIFKKESAPPSPLKDELRQQIDTSFHWLTTTFDKEAIRTRKVLRPHHSDFPIRYNGDQQTAIDTLKIVAPQMELKQEDLALHFYDDTINQISTGAPTGGKLSLGTLDDDSKDEPSYIRSETGKYAITIKISHLKAPEYLVASMARELAQVKLIGEDHLTQPDQRLTDLTTLIFGLGIFNANAAFNSQNLQLTGKNARLSQMEWGYGLALFAHYRGEKKPTWTEHLVANIKSDFQRSERYIAYHRPQ